MEVSKGVGASNKVRSEEIKLDRKIKVGTSKRSGLESTTSSSVQYNGMKLDWE